MFLLTEKITVLAEYLDFANIFLKKLAKVLFAQTGNNKHTIKLINNK